jgi:GNAT superfamily N-acetyltransferase
VLPEAQRCGVGGALLAHLRGQSVRRMLIGTWAAADWAVRFYRKHGLAVVPAEQKTRLLEIYWTVPDRQIEMSVVLANPPVS